MRVKILIFVLSLNAGFLVSFARPDCIPEITVANSRASVEVVDVLKICKDDQFQCRNEDCIEQKFLCDGRADCSDQSDETRSECSKPNFTCSKSEFRCDYGACVDNDTVCDGVKDCLDNSDELFAECPKPSQKRELVIHVSIDDEAENDDVEQREILIRKEDTKPTRRKVLYKVRRPVRPRMPEIASKSGDSKLSTPSTSLSVLPVKPSNYSLCVVPPQPPNGQWKLHSDFCRGNEDCDIPQNIALKPGSRLVYFCDTDFGVSGSADVYCGVGGNWSPIPECIATTCTPLNSISRAATCSRLGERVSCATSILPRTRAKVTCRVNYGLKSNSVPTFVEQDIECNQNGKWEPDPITCRPICGLENRSVRKQETVNGVSVEAGGFPWHANLWKEISSGGGIEHEFRCSATIIEPNFVLTAAHCVLDETSGAPENPQRLRVTAGNVYRDLNDLQSTSWIVQKVKNVYRNCDNSSYLLNDASDIALIELSESFQFSDAIFPVCLDDSRQSEQVFESGVTGKVDGFGINSVTSSSPMLQTVNVSHVPNSECRMPYNDSGIEVVIKNDELCGVYSNDTTVCDWDTGGGLVVQKNRLWHLVGIYGVGLRPSLVDAPSTNCRDNPYSLYTKISAYIPWIQDVFFKLERYKSYPTCSFYIPPRIQMPQNTLNPAPITSLQSSRNGANPRIPVQSPPNGVNPTIPVQSSPNGANPTIPDQSSPNGANPTIPVQSSPNGANPAIPVQSSLNEANPTISVQSSPNGTNRTIPVQSSGANNGTSVQPSSSTTKPPMMMMMPPPDVFKMQMPSNASSVSCMIPPQPTNGVFRPHPALCEGKTACILPEGAALTPGSQLVYSCLPGFQINGSPDVFCGLQGNWSATPTCIAITCPSLESASTIMACYQSNSYTPCNSSALPGTTASLVCRPAFTEDTSLAKAGSKSVKCNANGEWEPNPISCLPMCGITNTKFTPTVLSAVPADISQFPWHVTLYRQDKPPEGPKMFQCGGTIIQNNLVLTAAHCVYDDKFKTVELAEKFYVVTGNTFQDYDSPLHDPRVVKKSSVKSIHVPCEYFGLDGNYNSDIAIIELRESFPLSGILIPACMDVVGNNEQLLEPGSTARIAGFGGTATAVSSATLLTTNISYVSYSECKMSNSNQDNVGLISNDKFCGKGRNGAAVCQGDSGGGLVFQSDGRWNVMGVLSVNLGANTLMGEKACIPNSYALYTKVFTHMPWIRSVMTSLQKYKTYSICGSAR